MMKLRHEIKVKARMALLAFALLPLLSGCAAMNSGFDCGKEGVGRCESLDQVNKQADQGDFNSADSGQVSSVHSDDTTVAFDHYSIAAPQPGEPIRYGETVQRIWLAPYEDTNNNYHEPAYVYTVIQKGHWIGLPEKEIADTEA